MKKTICLILMTLTFAGCSTRTSYQFYSPNSQRTIPVGGETEERALIRASARMKICPNYKLVDKEPFENQMKALRSEKGDAYVNYQISDNIATVKRLYARSPEYKATYCR